MNSREFGSYTRKSAPWIEPRKNNGILSEGEIESWSIRARHYSLDAGRFLFTVLCCAVWCAVL